MKQAGVCMCRAGNHCPWHFPVASSRVAWDKDPLPILGPPMGLLTALQIEQLEEATLLIIPITVTWYTGSNGIQGDEMKAI